LRVEVDGDEVDRGVVGLRWWMHQVPDGALDKAGRWAEGNCPVVCGHEAAAEDAKVVCGNRALADVGRTRGFVLVWIAHCGLAFVEKFQRVWWTDGVKF
jgi:hypothetical protein